MPRNKKRNFTLSPGIFIASYLFIFINAFFVQISPPIPPVNSHHVYYKGTIQLHVCIITTKYRMWYFFCFKKRKQTIMRQLFQNKCARAWVTDISDVFLGDFQKTAKLVTLWWSLFFKKQTKNKRVCVRTTLSVLLVYFCLFQRSLQWCHSLRLFSIPLSKLCVLQQTRVHRLFNHS